MFFFYYNFYISLMLAGGIWGTQLVFNNSVETLAVLAGFCGAYCIYGLDNLLNYKSDKLTLPRHPLYQSPLPLWYTISIVSSGIVLCIAFFLLGNNYQIVLMVMACLLTFYYGHPILTRWNIPFFDFSRIRFFKTGSIILAWSTMLTLFPWAARMNGYSLDYLVWVLCIVGTVAATVILFNIDPRAGETQAKWAIQLLKILMIFVAFILLCFLFNASLSKPILHTALVSVLISNGFVWSWRPSRGFYYYKCGLDFFGGGQGIILGSGTILVNTFIAFMLP